MIYDNFIYHNALQNTSGQDRCALITSYQPLRLGAVGSQSGQVLGNAQRLLAAVRSPLSPLSSPVLQFL